MVSQCDNMLCMVWFDYTDMVLQCDNMLCMVWFDYTDVVLQCDNMLIKFALSIFVDE